MVLKKPLNTVTNVVFKKGACATATALTADSTEAAPMKGVGL